MSDNKTSGTPDNKTVEIIYYVTIYFDREVHTQACGFTKIVNMFAFGKSAAEAMDRTAWYCQNKYGETLAKYDNKIVKADAKTAIKQTLDCYISGVVGENGEIKKSARWQN